MERKKKMIDGIGLILHNTVPMLLYRITLDSRLAQQFKLNKTIDKLQVCMKEVSTSSENRNNCNNICIILIANLIAIKCNKLDVKFHL